jgi:oligogalacturonide transporter
MSQATPKANNSPSSKLKFSTKFWFAAADLYGGGAFNIINFYYAFFLTSVMGISPLWIAVVIPVSKIWDAVSDPLMGRISDNTRTKWGRRRPYFILGVPFIFLSFFLLWFSPNFPSQTMRAIFALTAYIFFSTVNTMVMVPYQAMMPELTDDYNERSSLAGIRIGFSLGASLLCAIIPKIIWESFADVRVGYMVMAVVFGAFFALPYIGTFFKTKERPEYMNEPKRKGNIFKELFETMKVKSFRKLVYMYLCSFLALDVITTLFIFFMTYYLGRNDMAQYVLGILILVEICSIPLAVLIAKKTSKKFSFALGCVLWAIFALSTLLITPEMNIAFMFGISVLMGVSLAMPVVMVFSIFSDVTDVGELYFQKRAEGRFSGVQTLIRKACSAGAIALVMTGLGWAGFKEGENMVQPESAILTIRLILAIVPAILLVIGAYIAKTMPLDNKIYKKLRKYLDSKRSGEPMDEELAAEVEGWKGTLL